MSVIDLDMELAKEVRLKFSRHLPVEARKAFNQKANFSGVILPRKLSTAILGCLSWRSTHQGYCYWQDLYYKALHQEEQPNFKGRYTWK
jgi:hypothetical protein